MHASASIVKKHHKEASADTICCRAFLHMASQLRPLQTKLDRDIAKCVISWNKHGTRTQYISGRH
eukprot:4058603-Amphidinium_carterae.1